MEPKKRKMLADDLPLCEGPLNDDGKSYCRYGGKKRGEAAETLLDYVCQRFFYYGREKWKDKIAQGLLTVDKKVIGEDFPLKGGMLIGLDTPREDEPAVDLAFTLLDYNKPLGLIAVEKSGNIPVSPSGKYRKNTLSYEVQDVLRRNVWPAHRLDKETSGIVIMALSEDASSYVNTLFSENKVTKQYHAVLTGQLMEETVIDTPVVPMHMLKNNDYCSDCKQMKKIRMAAHPKGKACRTTFTPMLRTDNLTLVRVLIEQGRTHQIRVHAEAIGHPILGDKVYGHGEGSEGQSLRWTTGAEEMVTPHGVVDRQLLHASHVVITTPDSTWTVTSDYKKYFSKYECCAKLLEYPRPTFQHTTQGMGKTVDAKVLDVYFEEAKIHSLLHNATAALCKVMPSDPGAFLAEHFSTLSVRINSSFSATSTLEEQEVAHRASIREQFTVGLDAFKMCFLYLPKKGVRVKQKRSLQFDDIINSTPCNGPLGAMVRSPSRQQSFSHVYSPFSVGSQSQSFHLGASMNGGVGVSRSPQEPDIDLAMSISDISREVNLSLADLRDHQLGIVAPVLTDEQVQAFHDTLSLLESVGNMRDALTFSSNLRWDHTLSRCVPGRVWKLHTPEDKRLLLDRPLTELEIERINAECKCHTAPSADPGKMPRVLYILGPAGAGKSTIRTLSENLLNINLGDYVEIEGDILRKHHKGWNEVLAGTPGEGYKDAMKIVSKHVDALKEVMLARAIRQRKNLLISKTGQDWVKFKNEVQQMQDDGYVVDAIGLVVSMKEAGYRAVNRAHENGRWHDPSFAKWANVMKSMMYLMDPNVTDNCLVFDNQNFTEPMPVYTRTHNMAYVTGIMEHYCTMDGGDADILSMGD